MAPFLFERLVAQRTGPHDVTAGIVRVANQPLFENRERFLGLSSFPMGIGEASEDEAVRLASILFFETPDFVAGR